MKAVCLHDKSKIETFLRRNVFLNIYALGDLDDFFWPYTSWYAWIDKGDIQSIALTYTGGNLPCLHAIAENGKIHYTEELLSDLISILPRRFYAHLSLGLEQILTKHYALKPYGEHYKMALADISELNKFDTSQVMALAVSDAGEIINLFQKSYPENYFEPRLLETNRYYGIRQLGKLISVGGVHVFSRKYRVTALGNIVTAPEYRNRGYATAVTAHICKSLQKEIDHIGLNVKADNTGALKCYKKLGFEVVASYGEFEVELKLSLKQI